METAWEGPCGAQEAPGPQKLGLDAGKAAKGRFKSLRICSEATRGAGEQPHGQPKAMEALIEGRAAQTARGQ